MARESPTCKNRIAVLEVRGAHFPLAGADVFWGTTLGGKRGNEAKSNHCALKRETTTYGSACFLTGKDEHAAPPKTPWCLRIPLQIQTNVVLSTMVSFRGAKWISQPSHPQYVPPQWAVFLLD